MIYFKSIKLFWYSCVVNVQVSSNLCFHIYLIYVNHLRCEETYKFPMKMYQINLTDLKDITNYKFGDFLIILSIF
jgi:hypothetical protein